MSRNLSLKKISPYLRSYSVRRSNQPIPSSFAKHFVNKGEISEQEDSDSHDDHEDPFNESKKKEHNNLAEFFELIENPDFCDLFELSYGKKESVIRLIIRKLRRERGVSNRLPTCYTNALKLNKNEIYRKSTEWYYNHQNNTVLFSI